MCDIGPAPSGFPNAGKSSIINGLLGKKVKCTPESAAPLKLPHSSSLPAVSICLSLLSFLQPLLPHHTPSTSLTQAVSVSRTPGHTKHFQTIYLTDSIVLCDCPGLVFPAVAEKQLQVVTPLSGDTTTGQLVTMPCYNRVLSLFVRVSVSAVCVWL